MKVQNGKEYYVRIYVHNNAASNLNLVAENVVAKLNVPTTTAKTVTVQGQVSAQTQNLTQFGMKQLSQVIMTSTWLMLLVLPFSKTTEWVQLNFQTAS